MRKTISIFTLALVAMILVIEGCQKQNQKISTLENISEISLQRLAEMNFDETLSEELYSPLSERIASLDADDYELYLNFWIKAGVQEMIDKKIIPESERSDMESEELLKRHNYNQKSLELYGVLMNKLSFEKQLDVANYFTNGGKNEKPQNKNITGVTTALASCPVYAYPSPVLRDQTGTMTCGAIYSVGNPNTPHCDWEFCFPLAITVYNRVKTSSPSALTIFAYGGVNSKTAQAIATYQKRFLVGQGKIDALYPGSGYSAAVLFSNDVRFRGLS